MAVTIEEKIASVNEKPHVKIHTDKGNHTWTVQPTFDGFVFYEVKQDKGHLPQELKGRFTRMKEAVEAVRRYERNMKVSRTVQRDQYQKKREERKAS